MAETNTEPTRRLFPIRWDWQVVLDILFVLVLPIACLALDPGILRAGHFGEGFLSEIQLPAYILIGLLIAAFWLSRLPPLSPFTSALLKGALITGTVLSGLFSIILAPLAVWFLPGAVFSGNFEFVALFLFGLVPPFTAHRYFRHLRSMLKRGAARKPYVGLAIAGIIAPPVLATAVYIGVGILFESSFRDLRSDKPDVTLSAATDLAESPFCLSACRTKVIRLYCDRKVGLKPAQFLPLFGGKHGNIHVTEHGCGSV